MRKAFHCVLGKALLCASVFLIFGVAPFATAGAQDTVFAHSHGGTTLYYVVDSNGNAMVVPPLYPDLHFSEDSTRIETWWGYAKPQGAVVVPDSVPFEGRSHAVTVIQERAFQWCDSMTAVTFPATLRAIAQQAFHGCAGLTSVYIPDGVELGVASFYDCTGMRTVRLPEDITVVPWACFNGDTSLEAVDIPAAVETIEKGAFSFCSSLSEVTLHEGLKTIGGEAFAGCARLREVTLPEGVATLGRASFAHCDSLRRIHLPSTLDSVDDFIFFSCVSLDSVVFPDHLRVLDTAMFDTCVSLTYIHLPEQLEVMSKWLLWGSGIESIEVPPHVTSVEALAFGGCLRLRKVTLPASVTHLGDSLFWDGTQLDSLILEGAVPPSLDVDVFPDFSFVVVVPCGAAAAYRQHPVWGRFADITERCTGIEDEALPTVSAVYGFDGRIVVSGANAEVNIYDLAGHCLTTMDADGGEASVAVDNGVYLVRVGDLPAKKVIVTK